MTATSSRARPLAPEDRRETIIQAVIPLLLEHGVAVTSKQIAEAAGVAEGTIFRAFGDKDSLIAAAADAFMAGRSHPEAIAIDSSLPLDDKIALLVDDMRKRVRGVIRMAMITGRRSPPPEPEQIERFNRMVAESFAPDAARLRVAPERLSQYVRILAIATSIPVGGPELTDDEIVQFITHGILAR